jgi:hypothetical protein
MSSEQGVVLFFTIHAVFRLQKALQARGVDSKPIPTPRYLSSDCGTALRFPWSHRADVESEIANLDLEIDSIHALSE